MKILFVANNPGGFRAMLPVIHQLEDASVAITPALRNLASIRQKTLFVDPDIKKEKIETFLKATKPRVVITGTSVKNGSGSQVENLFRLSSKKLKIPSVTILDHWCNYSDRFTTKEKCDALPDVICVMDKRAEREMMEEGFGKNILAVTGQPAFDELFQKIRPSLATLRKKIRKRYEPQGRRVIGFVSEPVLQDHGWIRGYDEKSVLEDILRLMEHDFSKSVLWIKLHPREPRGKYALLLKKYAGVRAYEIDESPYDFIAGCDRIVGMTSILLLQARLLGRCVASYQPRTDVASSWAKAIHPLTLFSHAHTLAKFLKNPSKKTKIFYNERNATRRVLKVLRSFSS